LDTSTVSLLSMASSDGLWMVHATWLIETPGLTCRSRPTVPVISPGASEAGAWPWPLEHAATALAKRALLRIPKKNFDDVAREGMGGSYGTDVREANLAGRGSLHSQLSVQPL
jgi:hypothetical protein